MSAKRYRIETWENAQTWSAGWEAAGEYTYCLSYVKQQANKMAKTHPDWSIRVRAEGGGIFWEHEAAK